MKPEKPFFITNYRSPTDSKCTIFVDGTAGDDFREGIDVELSHWIPNRTPAQYKAGTSTEICFKFLDDQGAETYDRVVNNHIDIDGFLSVFVMAYPSIALRYRDILCGASRAGDFWAWSEGKSFQVFQELTLFYKRLLKQGADLHKVYEKCCALLLDILLSPEKNNEAHEILKAQSMLIHQGKIQRYELLTHLVAYLIPQNLGMSSLDVPQFNEPISKRLSFWPQVRNRLDGEKIQLVGLEASTGIHYELWYPGYVWADTKGLWRPPGLQLPKTAGGFQSINWPELSEAIETLNTLELNRYHWELFPGLSFSNQKNSRSFPVVATTMTGSYQQPSSLPLEKVTQSFERLPHI